MQLKFLETLDKLNQQEQYDQQKYQSSNLTKIESSNRIFLIK